MHRSIHYIFVPLFATFGGFLGAWHFAKQASQRLSADRQGTED